MGSTSCAATELQGAMLAHLRVTQRSWLQLFYPLARLLAHRRFVGSTPAKAGFEPRLAEFARAQLSGSRFAHFFILCCGGMLVALLHACSQWGWLPAADLSDTVVGAGIAGLLVAAYVSLYGEPFVVRFAGIALYMPALGLLLATQAQDPAAHAQRLKEEMAERLLSLPADEVYDAALSTR